MKTANALALAIAACFVAVVIACAVIYVAAPDGENVVVVLTVLIGSLPPTLGALAALLGVKAMDRKVEYLANGGMDAKVRAGVADVLPDHLLDPKAAEQIEADRAYREAGPKA